MKEVVVLTCIDEAVCRSCGAGPGVLAVDWKFISAEAGTYSCAGLQAKVTGRFMPVLSCKECALQLVGEVDADGQHVTFPDPVDTPAGS